mgnify:CR=1 FL=1
MSEWHTYKLKDITTKIGSGSTPTGGSGAYKAEGITLIRSQNVLDYKFTEDGLAFIDDDQAYSLRNVIVEVNDVLLNITGDSVARCCGAPANWLPARVNQHVAILRSNPEKLDHRFLKYSLLASKEELLILSEIGGTRNALTKGMLEDYEVILPPLPEQKAIASVLSSLDDKIDLLHRQNKTLEAMAETLFRQWFIEEAKEDWEYVELGSVVETSSGGTPSRKEMSYYENGSIHWVKSKELNGSFITETEEMITDEAVKKSSAKLLPAYSTLIAMYGATVGEYALITKTMTCNQAVCALKENEAYPYTFIFMYVKNQKDELINQAVGSAQQNISQILIKKLPIPTCTARINEYHQLVIPWFKKMQLNVEQIQILEKLRDTLLPKLMSGEVRVQYQTEEVA